MEEHPDYQPTEQPTVEPAPDTEPPAVADATPKRTYTPEEMAELEAEMDKRRALVDMMKTHVLNQLEEESADSQFGALLRSKNFWYCVFGIIFFLWMGALILWVAHDLAK